MASVMSTRDYSRHISHRCWQVYACVGAYGDYCRLCI